MTTSKNDSNGRERRHELGIERVPSSFPAFDSGKMILTSPQPCLLQPVKLTFHKKLAFSAVALGFTLLIFEVALRIVWLPPREYIGMPFSQSGVMIPDEQLRWRAAPNLHLITQFSPGGREVVIRTNSRGFRDRERKLERDPTIPHVVVLGDSFVFGYGVSNGEIFTDYLEQFLPDVEVINLGVTAFNLAQTHKLLQLEGLDYKPTVIVIAFCQNDVTSVGIPLPDNPENVRAKQEAKKNDKHGWKQILREHSAVYHFTSSRIANSRPLTRFFVRIGIKDSLAGFESLNPSLRPALVDGPVELRNDWNAACSQLTAINKTCRNASAQLVVAPIPAREAVDPAELSRTISYTKYDPTDFERDKPYAKLAEYCQRENIYYVETVRTFREEGGRNYLIRDMHFSVDGHELFARILAPHIKNLVREVGAPK